MKTQRLASIHSRMQRVASRVPKAEGLSEEAIRRMSDKELDDAIRVAIQELEPGDPLRAQLQSALARA